MQKLFTLHDRIIDGVTAPAGNWLVPTLARFTFLATLFVYYWGSAKTKLGDGIGGLFSLNPNAYVQMFPKAMEAAGYDPSQLGAIYKLIAILGTWSEFLLPVLIVVGLLTRFASLGMIGFIAVQSWVDVNGHGAKFGSWFDNQSGDLIADQRLFWVFLLIVLIVQGAGKISLDRVLGIK